jgi:hypothetical protein
MIHSNMNTIRQEWGENAPDWVIALAEFCDEKKSQSKAAKEIGYSPAAINQVLKNKYVGDTQKLSEKIRGLLLKETVCCPEFGTMTLDKCIDYQSGNSFASSAQKIRFSRACAVCQNRKDL